MIVFKEAQREESQRDLEGVMLSEKSHSEEDKYHVTSRTVITRRKGDESGQSKGRG